MNVSPMDEGKMQFSAEMSMFDPEMLREALAKQIRSGVVGSGPTPQPPMKANTLLNLKKDFADRRLKRRRKNPLDLSSEQMAALTMFPGTGQTSADTSQIYRQG
tara:strand:- start:602 stop:913 length:312 start_codon:yes stop_codon:yes gene_type:complete